MIAIFFITDRYLKFLASRKLTEASLNLISDIFTFSFTPNFFIAFSLPLRGLWLNLAISLIIPTIIVFLIKAVKSKEKPIFITGLSFILAGAISNLIDRIQFGYVIDYLYLRHFTVFNLADVCISLGALLILASLYKKPSH